MDCIRYSATASATFDDIEYPEKNRRYVRLLLEINATSLGDMATKFI